MFGFDHEFFGEVIPLLWTFVWIVLLAVLAWALLRWLTTKNPSFIGYHTTPPQYQPSAIEILRQRYARGEINEETFHQMQERLEASTPPEQQQHF